MAMQSGQQGSSPPGGGGGGRGGSGGMGASPPPPPPPGGGPPPNPSNSTSPKPVAPKPSQTAKRERKPMRELRVEDALLYLDQVKIEFGNKPEIYNEFLDIMKNFKAQHIDTPGVIRRVSNLFRGYNKLILGFNTFLPDGYKIELSDIEEMNRVHALEQANMRRMGTGAAPQDAEAVTPRSMTVGVGSGPVGAAGANTGAMAPSGGPQGPSTGPGAGVADASSLNAANVLGSVGGSAAGSGPGMGDGGAAGRGGGDGGEETGSGGGGGGAMGRGSPHPPGHISPHPGAGVGGLAGAAVGHGQYNVPPNQQQQQDQRQMQNADPPAEFDHAITYVTTIKKRFSHHPETYKAFLEILHTYQKEQRGIKEVLEQVSTLFMDHADLLREFTYFLPDPVQEQARERLNRAAMESELRNAKKQLQAKNSKHGQHMGAPPHPHPGHPHPPYQMGHVPDGGGGGWAVTGAPPRAGKVKGKDKKTKKGEKQQGGYNYPHMGHPGLPGMGGMGGMGGPPMSKGGPPSPGGYGGGPFSNTGGMYQGPVGGVGAGGPGHGSSVLGSIRRHTGGNGRKVSAGAVGGGGGPGAPGGGGGGDGGGDGGGGVGSGGGIGGPGGLRRFGEAKRRKKSSGVSMSGDYRHQQLPMTEGGVALERIRRVAMESGQWSAFCNTLHNFDREVLTMSEFFDQLHTMLGEEDEGAVREFCRVTKERVNTLEDHPMRAEVWNNPPQNTDLSQCPKVTASYRLLPEDYPMSICRERTQLDKSVLNDRYSSSPVGTEGGGDGVSFKHARKSIHEDAIFKVEDERYELDMRIDLVASAVKVLAPVVKEMEEHNRQLEEGRNGLPSERLQYKIDKRCLGTLHLLAISKVYGDGTQEMFEILRKNPCGALPVIVRRLHQKEVEWRAFRTRANKSWEATQKYSYIKSLDKRSAHQKNEDKKRTSNKFFLADIKERRARQLALEQAPKPFVSSLPEPSVASPLAFLSADAASSSADLLRGKAGPEVPPSPGPGADKDSQELDTRETVEDADMGEAGGGAGVPSKEEDDEEELEGIVKGKGKPKAQFKDDSASSSSSSSKKFQNEYEDDMDMEAVSEEDKEAEEVLAHGNAVKAAESAVLERTTAETSAPHYMFSHIRLKLPPRSVQKDIHQLIVHAVNCNTSPVDRNKVLRALPLLRYWLGGDADWDSGRDNVSECFQFKKMPQAVLLEGEVVGTGTPKGSGLPPPSLPSFSDDSSNEKTDGGKGPGSKGAAKGKPAETWEGSKDTKGAAEDLGAGPSAPRHAQGVEAGAGAKNMDGGRPGCREGAGGGQAAGTVLPKTEHMIIGTQDLYLFLRLLNVISERIGDMVELANRAEELQANTPPNPNKVLLDLQTDEEKLAVGMGMEVPLKEPGLKGYKGFLAILYAQLETTACETKMEDAVQQMIGNEAFKVFNLDKMVASMVRHLKAAMDDQLNVKLLQLWHHQVVNGSMTKEKYFEMAARLTRTRTDSVYRFHYSTAIDPDRPEILVELLGSLNQEIFGGSRAETQGGPRSTSGTAASSGEDGKGEVDSVAGAGTGTEAGASMTEGNDEMGEVVSETLLGKGGRSGSHSHSSAESGYSSDGRDKTHGGQEGGSSSGEKEANEELKEGRGKRRRKE